MNREKWIQAADALGQHILQEKYDLEDILDKSFAENGWFTETEVRRRLNTIARDYLSGSKLTEWLLPYKEAEYPLNIGLILAGNLPAVGFHDCLSAMMMGHKLMIKCSHKDQHLIPFLLTRLFQFTDSPMEAYVSFVDKLIGYDAVIATGSDASMSHFKTYFKHVPHLLRGHRTSAAILTGTESEEDLVNLGRDIFEYYGLGCRNVSFLMVPVGYLFDRALALWERHFAYVVDNHKYKNNYDYNLAIYSLNLEPHLVSNNLVLLESPVFDARLASVNFFHYDSWEQVEELVARNKNRLQCIVSNHRLNNMDTFKFGQAQCPQLADYPDHLNTLDFLNALPRYEKD